MTPTATAPMRRAALFAATNSPNFPKSASPRANARRERCCAGTTGRAWTVREECDHGDNEPDGYGGDLHRHQELKEDVPEGLCCICWYLRGAVGRADERRPGEDERLERQNVTTTMPTPSHNHARLVLGAAHNARPRKSRLKKGSTQTSELNRPKTFWAARGRETRRARTSRGTCPTGCTS